MIDLSKKLIYASSLALLSLAGITKAYAADSDYSTLKPHSMLTTAYAAAWNDVNKASDAKGTGDGKAAQEEKAEEKADEKADEKGDGKDSKDSGKKDSGKGSKKGSSKGSSNGSKKGSHKNSEKRKEQLKAQERAEKQIAEIQKQNNRNNYYGNGGTVAHGNGGY